MDPNWKTTVTGIASALTGALTVLAAMPYELGQVADIIPPEWKPTIAMIGVISTVLLRILNAIFQKDSNVTGGTKPATAEARSRVDS